MYMLFPLHTPIAHGIRNVSVTRFFVTDRTHYTVVQTPSLSNLFFSALLTQLRNPSTRQQFNHSGLVNRNPAHQMGHVTANPSSMSRNTIHSPTNRGSLIPSIGNV